MVEKRNRLKVTRPGSLLSVIIDQDIDEELTRKIVSLVLAAGLGVPSEVVVDLTVNPEMAKYQAESR